MEGAVKEVAEWGKKAQTGEGTGRGLWDLEVGEGSKDSLVGGNHILSPLLRMWTPQKAMPFEC